MNQKPQTGIVTDIRSRMPAEEPCDLPAWVSDWPCQVRLRWVATAALLALAVAIPVWAQHSRIYRDGNAWVEETTGTLPASRTVRVNTDLGSVQVDGSAQQISYVVRKRTYVGSEAAARRQFEQFRVSAAKSGETATMEGRFASHGGERFSAEFVVHVPHNLEFLKIETRSGSLNLSSLSANVAAVTGGGNVKADGLNGPVRITSGGGNIEIGNLGSDLTLSSGGGDVQVQNVGGQARISLGGGRIDIGSAHGLVAQTGGGNIRVGSCAGDLRASTGGGNLTLGDVMGAVHADAGGGGIRLNGARGRVTATTGGGAIELYRLGQSAQAETGAGAITAEFVGGRGGFGDSSLHTAAGDVIVYLPSNLPVTVHASSDLANGRGIRSDFPELRITQEGGSIGPRSMFAEGTINGGGPMLRVRTTIGQIDFRRSR